MKTFIEDPNKKAFIVTLIFSVMGVIGWTKTVTEPLYSLPLIIFYATIVLNTYFSIKLFASLTPISERVQHVIDIALVCAYTVSAFSLDNTMWFALSNLFLFVIAAAKYSFLLNVIKYQQLLKRKILIDILGIFFCACVLTASLLGYSYYAAWGMSLGFLYANYFLFFVWPLYKIPDPEQDSLL